MTYFSFKALPFKSFTLPFTLQRREKRIVAAGGIALVLFLLIQVVIFPIMDRRTRLVAQITSGAAALREIQTLKSEFENLTRTAQRNQAQLKQRPPGFSLFSFLEGLAGQGGIKQNIVSMKPSTSNAKGSANSLSLVEMKIDGLTMEQLIAFLHGVETSGQMVWIKRLSIDKGEKENSLLNANLHVETFQLLP